MIDLRELMTALNEKKGDTEINAASIIKILQFSMECVEATELKGDAKKDLAIKLVRGLIEEAPITDEKEKLLLDMIDQKILHNTIDLVIDARDGKIDINTIAQVSTKCCGLLKKK